jgi:hypothetical protein
MAVNPVNVTMLSPSIKRFIPTPADWNHFYQINLF